MLQKHWHLVYGGVILVLLVVIGFLSILLIRELRKDQEFPRVGANLITSSTSTSSSTSTIKTITSNELGVSFILNSSWSQQLYRHSTSTSTVMLLLNPTPFELPDNWEGSLTPISIRRTKNQDAQKKAAEMLASDAGLVMEVVKVDQVPAIKLSGISQAEAYSTGHYVEMFYIQQGRDIIVLAEDTNKAQYQETFNQIVATLDIIQ